MRTNAARFLLSSLGLMLISDSNSALACAVCFGKSDTALAKGLHWGVLSLLAVVLCVLAGIVAFFICLAKRSAAVAGGAMPVQESVAETIDKN